MRNHFCGRASISFLTEKFRSQRIEIRKATRRHRAFHDPGLRSLFVACPKRGIVRGHHTPERIAGVPELRGILRLLRPQMHFLGAFADFGCDISPGTHERIRVFLPLLCQDNRLSLFSRSFLLYATAVNLKSIRHGHEQIPPLRWLTARAEKSLGWD